MISDSHNNLTSIDETITTPHHNDSITVHHAMETQKSDVALDSPLGESPLQVKSPGVDMPPAYIIEKGAGRVYAVNAAHDIPFRVRFNKEWAGHRVVDFLDELDMLFEDVLRQAGQDMEQGDVGRVIITHPALDNPIIVPLQPWHQLTPALIRQTIQSSVLNSNHNLTISTDFQIIIGTIHLPHGEARLHRLNDASYYRKKSIIPIENADNKCMIRAVAVGFAYALPEPESWQTVRARNARHITNVEIALLERVITKCTRQNLAKPNRNEQDTLVKLILEKTGLTDVNHFEIKTHIPILEKALNVHIFILDHQFKNSFVYKSDSRSIQIYLHLRKNHYDVINSLTYFFCKIYFCTMCLELYKNRQTHSCETHCIVCKRDSK